jgi:hypothetical protein
MPTSRGPQIAGGKFVFRAIRAGGAAISRRALILVAALSSVLALTVAPGRAQQAEPALPPLPPPVLQALVKDPEAWRQFVARHPSLPSAVPAVMAAPRGLGWTPLQNKPGGGIGAKASNPLLLTDGTVLIHVSCTSTWYRLKPDQNGSYQQGTWSLTAEMASVPHPVYAPRFFASAVLPDGRVIVEGGEYNDCFKVRNAPQVLTNLGAIYDPVADSWTFVDPPEGWDHIGDASSTLLDDGTFLLSDALTKQLAILDPTDLSWTEVGRGKFDINDEENWTLLPNGNILTVDAYVGTRTCGTRSEELLTDTFLWVGAGSTGVQLSGCGGSIPTFEAPTQILQPSGTVFAFGSTASLPNQDFPVHTARYNTATRRWSTGPAMPTIGGVYYTMADAPAAILPNGNVLIAASPSLWTPGKNGIQYPTPTHFFVFDGTTFTQVGDVADSPNLRSFEMNFLVLPTGEILGVETDFRNLEIFPAVCCSPPRWAPVITSLPQRIMVPNGSYKVDGRQLSGLTYGASYGDDEQSSTNYPLARLTNKATHHVFYAQTVNFTSASVAPDTASSTDFTLPSGIETGPSSLVVVANGIASKPVDVTIEPITATLTLTPSACIHFPQSGGKQTYTVAVKNPPPGMTLEYGWRFLLGGAEAQYAKLTVPGAVVLRNPLPAVAVGPSKSATLTAEALPSAGDGTGNAVLAELYYRTPQGQLFQVPKGGSIVYAQASFFQGAEDNCTGG